MSATIDQIIAERIGQETALPSLEVCSENETQAVACEAGFGCLYSSTLSYRNAKSPLPMESNPRKVFAQLFGEGATAEERVAIVKQKRSILDFITERTRALQLDLARPIKCSSTATWTRCERSNGAFSLRRAAISRRGGARDTWGRAGYRDR